MSGRTTAMMADWAALGAEREAQLLEPRMRKAAAVLQRMRALLACMCISLRIEVAAVATTEAAAMR